MNAAPVIHLEGLEQRHGRGTAKELSAKHEYGGTGASAAPRQLWGRVARRHGGMLDANRFASGIEAMSVLRLLARAKYRLLRLL